MLRILVVEDDPQLASTLKHLVEDNPRYEVVAIANDLDSAVAAAARHRPQLALVDLRLANGTTGFSVAVRLSDDEIPVLFVTGKAPDFPMPDLALGCLMKPFTAEDVHRAVAVAEDVMRGRETFRQRMPENLTFYEIDSVAPEIAEAGLAPSSRRSFKARLGNWLAGAHG